MAYWHQVYLHVITQNGFSGSGRQADSYKSRMPTGSTICDKGCRVHSEWTGGYVACASRSISCTATPVL